MDIHYHKRRLKANKMHRQIQAARVLLIRLRVFLALVITVCLLYFIFWILNLPQWYINGSKPASLKSVIVIQGNSLTPDEKILETVKNTKLPYTQIYKLDTKPLKNNIEKLQSVKKVYIKRYWFPARLIIVAEERVPAFLLTPNLETEPNSALTIDGILIDKEYLTADNSKKAKTILTYGIKDGHEVVWDKKIVEKLTEIVKAFEIYSGLEVKYIDLRNEKDCYIMLDEYLIRFGEINDTALTRIKWIAPILPEAKKNKDNIKYIDLRWEDSRYFCLKNNKEEKTLTENNQKSISQDKKSNNNNIQEEKYTNESIRENPINTQNN